MKKCVESFIKKFILSDISIKQYYNNLFISFYERNYNKVGKKYVFLNEKDEKSTDLLYS